MAIVYCTQPILKGVSGHSIKDFTCAGYIQIHLGAARNNGVAGHNDSKEISRCGTSGTIRGRCDICL